MSLPSLAGNDPLIEMIAGHIAAVRKETHKHPQKLAHTFETIDALAFDRTTAVNILHGIDQHIEAFPQRFLESSSGSKAA